MIPSFAAGNSSYVASKLAAAKLVEALALEHPALRVFNLQPGVVRTEMSDKVVSAGAAFELWDDGGSPFPLLLAE